MPKARTLPAAGTVGAAALTLAVLFAAVVIGATRILPAVNRVPAPGSPTIPAAPVPASAATQWSGVAQLNGTCTGALLDTGHPDSPAYLLTAGHCTSAVEDGNAVVLSTRVGRGAEFERVVGRQPVSVPVIATTYATMKGTDLAVVELDSTLGQLTARGLHDYPVTSVEPGGGLPVTNVAIPVNGVPEADQVLRLGSCTLGPRADVVEFGWHFDRVMTTNCPGVLGGSSGSPLFDGGTIVGVINTTTGGALPGGACYLNAPCERTADGVRVVPDRSYAVGVAGIAGCFPSGTFQLAAGCPLPPPGVTLRVGQRTFTAAALGTPGAVRVELVAHHPTPVRVGVARAVNRPVCSDPATYSGSAIATPAGTPYPVSLTTSEGVYFLCVAAVGDLADAAVGVYSVDDTPPVRTPSLSALATVDGLVKIGPEASTDCADVRYRRVKIEVPASELPARVCVIGSDLAGNAGLPWSQVLPKLSH